jgi:uncharacterized protein YukE
VAASDDLRVDPMVVRGFAEALRGGAEELRSAYASAWELWHRGAGEVEVGLLMLAKSVARAGGGYQENEAVSARALRGVRGG